MVLKIQTTEEEGASVFTVEVRDISLRPNFVEINSVLGMDF